MNKKFQKLFWNKKIALLYFTFFFCLCYINGQQLIELGWGYSPVFYLNENSELGTNYSTGLNIKLYDEEIGFGIYSGLFLEKRKLNKTSTNERFEFSYLNIPIEFHFLLFKKNKLRLMTMAGFSLRKTVNTHREYISGGIITTGFESYCKPQSQVLLAQAGLSFSFPLVSKVYCKVSPRIRYHFEKPAFRACYPVNKFSFDSMLSIVYHFPIDIKKQQ